MGRTSNFALVVGVFSVLAGCAYFLNSFIKKPRLKKLIIKNYRCIGSTPVEIELNDIVVLVGANNAGKSSILKAYELAMSQGSSKADLKLEDFPNNIIDPENSPEIELQTIVYDNSPGDRWIKKLKNGEGLVRERWIWAGEGKPKRLFKLIAQVVGCSPGTARRWRESFCARSPWPGGDWHRPKRCCARRPSAWRG
jgi:AAA ATPase domain